MFRAFFILTCAVSFFSCQKEMSSPETGENGRPVTLHFAPVVAQQELIAGSQYQNTFSELFTVSALRFYVHDVRLVNTQTGVTSRFDRNTYHLVDVFDETASRLNGSVSAGSYDAISFVLGVDSIYNVSGAQDGALDPLNGMFWTWNTGYIMAKFEGNSAVASTPNNVFQYHIGGFGGDQNVVKRITVPLSASFDPSNYNNAELKIECDILRWFDSTYPIRISQNPVCMTPGDLAKRIAANYYNMFRFSSVAEIP